jgi:hypothetical protein
VRAAVYATKDAIVRGKADTKYDHALKAAAVMVAVGRAFPSHHSAAIIHGLDLLHQPPKNVVTFTRRPPGRSGRPATPNLIFHAAALSRDHVDRVFGLLVTSAARTVVDIARTSGFMEGVVVADCVLRLGKATKGEMRAVLDACAQWPGAKRAARVIDFADGLSESVLESCARVVFHEYGLPAPELQVHIYDANHVEIGRVDFYWPAYRTIAEADGLIKYKKDGQERAIRQLERDQDLRRTRRKVVHFRWRDVFPYPMRLINEIRSTFDAPV